MHCCHDVAVEVHVCMIGMRLALVAPRGDVSHTVSHALNGYGTRGHSVPLVASAV